MSIHKRTVLGKLPPNVMLHLNRFKMNLDTFQTEKVNTRFEFPSQLDLEPFTKEVRCFFCVCFFSFFSLSPLFVIFSLLFAVHSLVHAVSRVFSRQLF